MTRRFTMIKRIIAIATVAAIMLSALPFAFAAGADKLALVEAIKAAEAYAYNEANYSPTDWEAFQSAFALAVAVADNDEATIDDVDAAIYDLLVAIDAMEKSAAYSAEETAAEEVAAEPEAATEPEVSEEPAPPVITSQPAVTLYFDNPYLDINENQWFYDSVAFAYTRGFMKGTGTDPMMFSPFIPTTRGMIITVMYRIAGNPDVSELGLFFNDVAEGDYYADAVKWGLNNGIIQGYGNGNFGPNDDITREQLVMIIYRYEALTGAEPPHVITERAFVDADSINAPAREAARQLYLQGIVTAKQGDFFEPGGLIARGELVAMVKRYVEAVE